MPYLSSKEIASKTSCHIKAPNYEIKGITGLLISLFLKVATLLHFLVSKASLFNSVAVAFLKYLVYGTKYFRKATPRFIIMVLTDSELDLVYIISYNFPCRNYFQQATHTHTHTHAHIHKDAHKRIFRSKHVHLISFSNLVNCYFSAYNCLDLICITSQ